MQNFENEKMRKGELLHRGGHEMVQDRGRRGAFRGRNPEGQEQKKKMDRLFDESMRTNNELLKSRKKKKTHPLVENICV